MHCSTFVHLRKMRPSFSQGPILSFLELPCVFAAIQGNAMTEKKNGPVNAKRLQDQSVSTTTRLQYLSRWPSLRLLNVILPAKWSTSPAGDYLDTFLFPMTFKGFPLFKASFRIWMGRMSIVSELVRVQTDRPSWTDRQTDSQSVNRNCTDWRTMYVWIRTYKYWLLRTTLRVVSSYLYWLCIIQTDRQYRQSVTWWVMWQSVSTRTVLCTVAAVAV